jgi:hypothetical protein
MKRTRRDVPEGNAGDDAQRDPKGQITFEGRHEVSL